MRFVRGVVWSAMFLASTAGCMNITTTDAEPLVRDADRQVRVAVYSWKWMREQHVVMQQRDFSCGSACVATICRYYWGDNVTEDDFLLPIINRLTPAEMEERQQNGLSMTDLRLAAVNKGYVASIGRITMDKLVELKAPVIVRIKVNEQQHFVVLRGLVQDRVFLADPIRGNVRLSVDEFICQWTDGAVLAIAKPGVKLPENAPLKDLPCGVVRPELEAGRRSLFVTRSTGI